jgi:hypothetical protein
MLLVRENSGMKTSMRSHSGSNPNDLDQMLARPSTSCHRVWLAVCDQMDKTFICAFEIGCPAVEIQLREARLW